MFHLQSDPQELEDVASERPEELARLRALAIAYVLEHRPGNFLLVHTGAKPARLRVSTRALRTLVGPPPRLDGSSDPPQSSVNLAGDAWALLEVEGPDAAHVVVQGLEQRGPATGFEPWLAGRLSSLREAGVWRVHGPEPRGRADTGSPPVDAELLEALRRLGYAE